ncbi:MAG: hypothetical protein N5P05_003360 [Chroococcopsis gigantea SAG 12.99]|nr:ATP-binding protein [Chlorogloea purpurea SAG 13.99]MDV3001754.1 hypothetical protein [Chroococcopsis gigantea SAG 12.99]
MELTNHFLLRVTTDLNALVPVLQWFEKTTEFLLPETVIWQCKVALAEGFTNTVIYAHENLAATTPIEIDLTIDRRSLMIRIWNYGKPFDLEAKLKEIQENILDPLEHESFRGLLFMQAFTDELRYVRLEDDRNCLVMSKVYNSN